MFALPSAWPSETHRANVSGIFYFLPSDCNSPSVSLSIQREEVYHPSRTKYIPFRASWVAQKKECHRTAPWRTMDDALHYYSNKGVVPDRSPHRGRVSSHNHHPRHWSYRAGTQSKGSPDGNVHIRSTRSSSLTAYPPHIGSLSWTSPYRDWWEVPAQIYIRYWNSRPYRLWWSSVPFHFFFMHY